MQQTNTNNRTCCGSIVTYTCTVTESSSLVWAVGPIAVAFVSVSSINTPVVRGEYEFVLVSVAPNLNNPTFSDFISTLTVTADGAVNGTVIECDDLINPSNATLMLNSSKYMVFVCFFFLYVLQRNSQIAIMQSPPQSGHVQLMVPNIYKSHAYILCLVI